MVKERVQKRENEKEKSEKRRSKTEYNYDCVYSWGYVGTTFTRYFI